MAGREEWRARWPSCAAVVCARSQSNCPSTSMGVAVSLPIPSRCRVARLLEHAHPLTTTTPWLTATIRACLSMPIR
eukprot:2875910-Prymnesium_polylepis.1